MSGMERGNLRAALETIRLAGEDFEDSQNEIALLVPLFQRAWWIVYEWLIENQNDPHLPEALFALVVYIDPRSFRELFDMVEHTGMGPEYATHFVMVSLMCMTLTYNERILASLRLDQDDPILEKGLELYHGANKGKFDVDFFSSLAGSLSLFEARFSEIDEIPPQEISFLEAVANRWGGKKLFVEGDWRIHPEEREAAEVFVGYRPGTTPPTFQNYQNHNPAPDLLL